MELHMTAQIIDAKEALAWGLVNHVVEAEKLAEFTRQLLATILGKSPVAVSKVVAAINAAMDPALDGYAEEIRLFGQCFGTEDMKEGVSAFLEKRKAAFPGR
jgi:enoyl-CoA hydratase